MKEFLGVKLDSDDPSALSDLSFWNEVSARRLAADRIGDPEARPLVKTLNALCSNYTLAMAERVAAQHLQPDPNRTMLEVGCAPGNILMRFHHRLKYRPFGLDYAPTGVEETQRNFTRLGIDPGQVYTGDLFDPQATAKHCSRYDLVMSFGLIEHYSNPREAIKHHLNFVKPGGHLLIYIPKLVGISYLSMWLLRRHFIRQHNFSIMRQRSFAELFQGMGLESLYCGHVGFIQLYGLFSRHEATIRGAAAKIATRIQMCMNAMMRVALLNRNVTWRWSPALLYVGRKVDTNQHAQAMP